MDDNKTPGLEQDDIEILDPAEWEWESIDGIKEAAFILKCIQSTFPNGDPVFDAIDRGRMTKVLMTHIKRL